MKLKPRITKYGYFTGNVDAYKYNKKGKLVKDKVTKETIDFLKKTGNI